MQAATREEIVQVFGEIDDLVVAAIEGLDATVEDVRRAREWMLSSSIERREGHVEPRLWKILDLLQDSEPDETVYEQ